MPLTDVAIRSTQVPSKPRKLADGGGLHLLLKPDGARLWRLKYRFAGVEKSLSFGPYPDVTLKEARLQRENAKRMLREGIDPSAARKAARAARSDRSADSFEVVAREWFTKMALTWEDVGGRRISARLETYVYPYIGHLPVREIRGPDLLDVLRRIEDKGHRETAHRVRQYLGAVFRYAVATHRAEHDPSFSMKGALLPVPKRSFAAITEPLQVGALLRAIRGYTGKDSVRLALQLLPYLFVRPGELRAARWDEFNVDWQTGTATDGLPEWRIPAARMKMRIKHIVPLSTQAIKLLMELHGFTGPDGYLFPSVRSKDRCISDNTLNAALRNIGYDGSQMTAHGFRTMASTLLHEKGYRSEWIERQLAHGDTNEVRARYNHAQYLEERRTMMQEWADYLQSIESQKKV